MSAPTHEKPATEQPTQPLPIAGTEDLPGGGNWLMSEWSVLLIPGTILAAIGTGELVLRPYFLLADEARSDFALTGLGALFLAGFVVFLFARPIGRGKDGRS